MNKVFEQNSVEIYQLRFFMKGVSPLIWRRLLIPSNNSIKDLHYAIQISMGWGDYHLNKFNIWGKEYGVYHDGGINFSDDPENTYLKDFKFRVNEKFSYEYNFFDHWEHEFRVEKILPFDSKKTYPFCTAGHYVAPPEDCGGPEAFMQLVDEHSLWKIEGKIIEAVEQFEEEQDSEAFQETIESLSYWVNRHKFDREKINRQLQRYFNSEDDLTVEEIQDED